MKNSHSKNSGFTLIETFVAITILLIAVLGPLTILSRSIVTSTFVKNEVTAYYLGQSAIEDVISYQKSANIENILTDQWLGDLVDDCSRDNGGLGCTVNTEPTGTFDVSISKCNLTNRNCDFVKRVNRSNPNSHINDDPEEGNKYNDGVYSSIGNIIGGDNGLPRNYAMQSNSPVFTRKIYVTPTSLSDNSSAKIEVEIGWSNGTLGLRSFTLSTYIFNYLTQ